MGWRGRVLGVAALGVAIVFVPTAIMLAIGMMPTVAVALLNRFRGAKMLTVGAMNLAGCFPFIVQLWTKGNQLDASIAIIGDPRTIIVIYSAAAIGYMIDWSVTGIVAGLMVQNGKKRQKDIKKRQEDLVKRWGMEVTGEIPLDEHGFPVEVDGKEG